MKCGLSLLVVKGFLIYQCCGLTLLVGFLFVFFTVVVEMHSMILEKKKKVFYVRLGGFGQSPVIISAAVHVDCPVMGSSKPLGSQYKCYIRFSLGKFLCIIAWICGGV